MPQAGPTERSDVGKLIASLNRGREAWLSQQLLDGLLRRHELRTEKEIPADLEVGLQDAVDALIVRDGLPLSGAMYATGATILPPDQFPSDPLNDLLSRCPRPLETVLRWLRITVGELTTKVVLERTDRTLQSIADDMGVTRERVRQHEKKGIRIALAQLDDIAPEVRPWWRQELMSFAASEERLLGTLGATFEPPSDALRFGRALLQAIGAQSPEVLSSRGITGWWTLQPERMKEVLEGMEVMLPCTREDLDALVSEHPVSEAAALSEAISAGVGRFRYHDRAGVWVRSGAQDRDAAWLILHEHGESMSTEVLADMVGLLPHALNEALRRDERFVIQRPSGQWKLHAWLAEEPRYSTTLEAVVDVLWELGPLTLSQLTRAVQERYAVTVGAVQQCQSHPLIGRWPDGRVDLAERGAPPVLREQPRQSADVERLPDERIRFTQMVDRELLRGSGLGVSPSLTWMLGLRSAPSTRTFTVPGRGSITIRYGIHGSTISTLRSVAEDLGARAGCKLAITLDEANDQASVALSCEHDHRGAG